MRFVILEHAAPDGVHWDFMLELPDQELLATWRLAANPLTTVGSIETQRIGDHRRTYLDFEGDIGGGRGKVHRAAHGTAIVVSSNETWLIEFTASKIRGRALLPAASGESLFCASDPGPST